MKNIYVISISKLSLYLFAIMIGRIALGVQNKNQEKKIVLHDKGVKEFLLESLKL